MKTSLQNSSVILDNILDILWRQWCAIGLKGHGGACSESVVDIEALVLATCSFGRYDARLFDGMIEWLETYGRYFNPQRARTLISRNCYGGADILAAVSSIVSNPETGLKWMKTSIAAKKIELEPLFMQKGGAPLPVSCPDVRFASAGFLRDAYHARSIIGPFDSTSLASLSIRLRAFIGVGARAEILLYLLQSREGSPREMARRLGFSPAAIGHALQEMSESGVLSRRENGRRLIYWLNDKDAVQKLFRLSDIPLPFPWASVFSVIEAVYLISKLKSETETDAVKASSSLRSKLRLLDLEPLAECTSNASSNLRGHEYLAYWIAFAKDLRCP